jgi:excisionase family DNA binding protein
MKEPIAAALLDTLHSELERIARVEVLRALDERLPRWLTVPQAAERIGIGRSAVRERIRQGALPARKWEGRWYVASADIDAAIAVAPSATVTALFNNKCPRDVGASGGAATRRYT